MLLEDGLAHLPFNPTPNSSRLYWGYFDGRAPVKRSGKWAEMVRASRPRRRRKCPAQETTHLCCTLPSRPALVSLRHVPPVRLGRRIRLGHGPSGIHCPKPRASVPLQQRGVACGPLNAPTRKQGRPSRGPSLSPTPTPLSSPGRFRRNVAGTTEHYASARHTFRYRMEGAQPRKPRSAEPCFLASVPRPTPLPRPDQELPLTNPGPHWAVLDRSRHPLRRSRISLGRAAARQTQGFRASLG